jgi:hypothetical protein
VISTRAGLALTAAVGIALASGCQNAPGLTSPPTTTASPQPAATSPSGSGTPAAAPGATAVASPGAVAQPATVEVSPSEVRIGEVVMTLAFEPPRHMIDRAMVMNTANQDPARPTPAAAEGVSKGAVVLDDMLRVTNNMDPSQAVPPDSSQSVVRHAVLNIKSGGAALSQVPYLTINVDMLLDGRPVGFGQPVVPMVAGEANPPNLYYGNNVRLGSRGTYQVFVRMAPNPLLGNGQPQAAQFNVAVR